MRKQVVAFIAALVITGIVALFMVVAGVNAMTNPNSVPVSNSPSQSTTAITDPSTSASAQTQIAQLQGLVAQYQAQEQQYQAALQQADQQVQSIQQLLLYLQSRGVIRIDSQGNITVP